MSEIKRYDGNPSGHISMDTRAMAFAKEQIHKEEDHMENLRVTGMDQSATYATQGRSETAATVFPTPRVAPMTDRSIKLFKDFTAEDLDGARVSGKEHWMKFTRPGDGVEGPAAELVDSEETARRKMTEAVARDKREYSDLNQKKELIERQIEELENVIAFKRRKDIENLQKRSERPFACLPMTHRASYPVHKRREEWQNGLIVSSRRSGGSGGGGGSSGSSGAMTARVSARLSSQEIGNHTGVQWQRRGARVGALR